MQHIIDRFVSYVIIDTESDASSETTPSTFKQFDLANLLVDVCSISVNCCNR